MCALTHFCVCARVSVYLSLSVSLSVSVSVFVWDGDYRSEPGDFVVGNGCGPLLEVVVSVLGDEDDCVLIPSPYYHAFSIGACRQCLWRVVGPGGGLPSALATLTAPSVSLAFFFSDVTRRMRCTIKPVPLDVCFYVWVARKGREEKVRVCVRVSVGGRRMLTRKRMPHTPCSGTRRHRSFA